jgi:hypothetical protein
MGLDYSYMLYFKRERLADVLMGVADISEPHHPPTQIHFPDHVLTIPLGKLLPFPEDNVYQYDDAELTFDNVLIFDEDEAIADWGHGQEIDNSVHLPPDLDYIRPLSVGYIYLTVYNDLSIYSPEIKLELKDLVLFDFGTTGTRMSLMFRNSTSIRKTFIELLRRFHGVCGLFSDEEKGEVFWLDGKEVRGFVDDIWTSPEEISRML